MGSIVLATALFLGLGLSLSWVVGQKERVELSEKLTDKTVEEQKLKIEIKKRYSYSQKKR